MKFLKRNITPILLAVLIVVIIVVAAGAYYEYQKSQELQVTSADTSGAIFSVATSTGATYFTVTSDGKVGIDTDSPAAALEVNGAIRLTRKSPVGCSSLYEGTIAYNPDNKHFWGCNGSSWNQLDN